MPQPFDDPALREALERAAARMPPNPELIARIERIFVARPWFQTRRFYALAASVLIVIAAGIVIVANRGRHHDHADEYFVEESALWNSIAALHDAGGVEAPVDAAALARELGSPVATLPAPWKLVRADKGEFSGVPAALLRYRHGDQRVTLLSADAKKVVRDVNHEEGYDEIRGNVRLVGGNRKGVWICALGEKAVNGELLHTALAQSHLVFPQH